MKNTLIAALMIAGVLAAGVGTANAATTPVQLPTGQGWAIGGVVCPVVNNTTSLNCTY